MTTYIVGLRQSVQVIRSFKADRGFKSTHVHLNICAFTYACAFHATANHKKEMAADSSNGIQGDNNLGAVGSTPVLNE